MTSTAYEPARTAAPTAGSGASAPAPKGSRDRIAPKGSRDRIAPKGSRDRIVLTGLRASGRHGVFDHEREQGQDFVVDVALTLDLTPASTSDDLSRTVDYGTLAEAVVADVQGEPLNLVEALAERIAQTCLREAGVSEVEVTVHKPEAPITGTFTDVAVTLIRSRA